MRRPESLTRQSPPCVSVGGRGRPWRREKSRSVLELFKRSALAEIDAAQPVRGAARRSGDEPPESSFAAPTAAGP